jgi:ParB family chromosome partitioning protein
VSKKGLGRGLGALITERETESSEIKEIMLADILPNPGQPRREFDEEKLAELANSIREHGLLQPILVKPEGNRYYIIAGERRFRASKMAGLDRINCIVRDCSDQEMTEKALIENIQRADLSPVEEGRAYARLIEEYGLTQEQVAKRVGKGSPLSQTSEDYSTAAASINLLNKGYIFWDMPKFY